MSNIRELTRYLYGIENYLRNQGIETTPKTVSKILIDFLKSKNLPYVKYNPNYRGLFSDSITNSKLVQENFKEFKEFITSKASK